MCRAQPDKLNWPANDVSYLALPLSIFLIVSDIALFVSAVTQSLSASVNGVPYSINFPMRSLSASHEAAVCSFGEQPAASTDEAMIVAIKNVFMM